MKKSLKIASIFLAFAAAAATGAAEARPVIIIGLPPPVIVAPPVVVAPTCNYYYAEGYPYCSYYVNGYWVRRPYYGPLRGGDRGWGGYHRGPGYGHGHGGHR